MMIETNPFTRYLISPLSLGLPSGDSVNIPRCEYLFRRWEGKPIRDTYGGKALIEFDRKPVFAELAILGTLRRAGWDGVWVDTYRRKFRRGLPPDCCELPSPARRLYDRIRKANNSKISGCFDVFAWKGKSYLFVESKRRSKDSIQVTQKAWIEAVLHAGVPLDSLLICEWDFPREGTWGDIFETPEDVEDRRKMVEELDAKKKKLPCRR
jgi:hypothetical protein